GGGGGGAPRPAGPGAAWAPPRPGAPPATPAVPPEAPSSTDPEPPVPPSAQSPSTDTTAEPAPVAGLAPAQYADLFDRMRAGFKLEAKENRAVETQLNWFVNNPDYLERAFARSELYLYHIVPELESRRMPLA